MWIEESPMGYELSEDRLRRIAHNVKMAGRYGDETGEIAAVVHAIGGAIRGARRVWAHLRNDARITYPDPGDEGIAR